MAIIEYLEELYPEPTILPIELLARARVRALAQLIVSDVHSLNTARVIDYLDGELGLSRERQQGWLAHWMLHGLRTFESLLARSPETGKYCHGDRPTLADICLVPQLHAAGRFGCDVSDFPIIHRIVTRCLEHPAFQRAAPENQPDAPGPLRD